MSATIQNISLYIPHIFANYTKDDVVKVFNDQNIGKVKNIDFVSKMSQEGKFYNAAYVHFEEWYNTIVARNFQARVLDTSKEARLMYEEPWYWIVLENKARKFIPGERKPRIILDVVEPSTLLQSTPVKDTIADSIDWTMAPVKAKVPPKKVLPTPMKLSDEFAEEEMDWDDYLMEEQAIQMDELEADIEEEDQYLVSVDSRYIQALEEENANCRMLCNQYYAEYCKAMELYKTEAIKSQALAEAIQMIKK
jgi:hypothetical protein